MIIAKKYFHVVVMLLLTFGIGILPPFGQITEVGMNVLGVFIGVIYGWIFVDLITVSLFGLIALGLTGYMTVGNAFVAGFSNATLLTILIVSVFAELLNQIGVNKLIAYWLLSKKIFIGKPWFLISGLCVLAFIMGIISGSFAGVIIVWYLLLNMAEINGFEKGNVLINMIMALTLYCVCYGGIVAPFQANFILFTGMLTQGTGLTVPALLTFFLGTLFLFFSIGAFLLFAKYILKLDASKFLTTEAMCNEYSKIKPNNYQMVGLILLLVYIMALLLPEIAGSLPIAQFCRSFGIIGFSLAYLVIFALMKNNEGIPLANIYECFQNGIPWAVIVLLAVTFPLSAAMQSDATGIIATVHATLVPLAEKLGPTMLIILSFILLGFLTQFLHNVILAAIAIPVLTPLVSLLGGNPYTFFFVILIIMNAAYATPAASAVAGLLFGHPDVNKKDAYCFGWLYYIISVVVLLVMIPLCNILYVV